MALSFAGRAWFQSSWSEREWKRIRIIFVVLWLPWIPFVVFSYSGQPVPTGLSRWLDLSFLTWPGLNVLVVLTAAAACWWYIRGKAMLPAVAVMSVLGILVFTLHDSQGAFQRNEVMNLVLLGQLVALVQAAWRSRKGREMSAAGLRNSLVFNSQQMLLATYFISGITKLSTSGLGWIADSPNVSLQIYKAQMELYDSLGWPFLRDLALTLSQWTAGHPVIVRIVFAGALFLELFCVAALLHRQLARWVGWGLLAMHAGIFVLLGVLFIPFIGLDIVLLVGLERPPSLRSIPVRP